MGKIKKLLDNELVGGTQSTDVYPVTSIKAVYDEDNERLDNVINRRGVVNISTNYNSDHIAEIFTLEQAISKVPSKDRVLGFQGRFLTSEGWKSYIFDGDSLSDWSNISKWVELISASVLAQELGDSTAKAISQAAVTKEISNLDTKFSELENNLSVLGSTNFIKDCYNPSNDSNVSLSIIGVFRKNTVFDYIGESAYFDNSASGILDCRYILSNFPKLSEGLKIRVIAELNILNNPVGGNVQVSILKNTSDVLSDINKEYNQSGRFIYDNTFDYTTDIEKISLFIKRYKEPATIEIGRVYIGLDCKGSIYGDYNIINEIKSLNESIIEKTNTLKQEFQNTGSYNFINPFDIISSNCGIQNGKSKDNTLFNYNGKMYEFTGNNSSVTDCRIVFQKIPNNVRIGSKLRIIAEIFAENIPERYFIETSIIAGGGSPQYHVRVRNGYSLLQFNNIEVTEAMKGMSTGSLYLFMPIQTFAYPGKITIGRVYIGYDSTGSIVGDYNIQQDILNIKGHLDESDRKISNLGFNNSLNFLTSCTDINSDTRIGMFNAEVVDNTIFNYKGKMIKYSGGSQLKDCRFFMQYIPEFVKVGQKLKILAEVYVEGTTYANLRPLVANVVRETTTLKQGYNIYQVNNIDVTESLKNSNVGSLGVFIPLQSGKLSVYIGRVYLGLDGEGSIIGDTNLENRIKDIEDINVKEKLDFLSNAKSPVILVSPNNERYKLDVSNDGTISASKISFKKPLFLGNSFVSHSPNEKIGWTPTEAWGMAAETKEKDFVHSLFNKIKLLDNNAEIADIINIVPFEQNPNMDLSKYDYINSIDFDCIFLKIGENVSNFENLDLKIIDLFDNHILQGKRNIPIFVASEFSAPQKTNKFYEYSLILKKVSDYYNTPFVWIDVNTGTPNNIYSAILTPLPPKSDGSQWDKSQVQGNVLNGHPGNLGHEYIAQKFYDAIKLYYKY